MTTLLQRNLSIALFSSISRVPDSMKPIILFATGLLFLAFSASAQGQTISCPTTAADTTGWTHYDEGDFSFKLPPRFEEVKTRSIDSQRRKWHASEASVYYDFGSYSSHLDPDKERWTYPELSVCQEGEGWDTPRIVVYHDEDTGAPRMGAHWADQAHYSDGDDFGYTLTIGGAMSEEFGFSEMLSVIQSVRFSWRGR